MATTLNFVTFNQDYSCLAVGTTRGFRIYYTDPFSKCFESTDGNISLLEMLFSTSLVAFVLSPRRLQIKNTKRETTICELTFPSAILAVRLNRKRLAVVLEEQIYLYDISNMKLLYTIETSPNPTDNCYLAYPLPKKSPYSGVGPPAHSPPTTVYLTPTSGEVLLFDALKLEAVNLVEAHRSPLSSIAMNNEGTLLATASDKGTIIRVFSVPQAEKLYQFRRGSIPSTIYNMSFNLNSTLLCVSSATETVHVFRLGGSSGGRSQHEKDHAHHADASFQRWRPGSRGGAGGAGSTSPISEIGFPDAPGLEKDHLSSSSSSPPPPPPPTDRKHDGSLGSILRRSSQTVGKTFASSVGSYLPAAVTEMWEPARDFAFIKIPKESHSESGSSGSGGGGPGRPVKSVVAMSSSRPHMMVVTSEGMFYVFGIDMAKGGEGVLLKQYTLLDSSDQPGQSALDID